MFECALEVDPFIVTADGQFDSRRTSVAALALVALALVVLRQSLVQPDGGDRRPRYPNPKKLEQAAARGGVSQTPAQRVNSI